MSENAFNDSVKYHLTGMYQDWFLDYASYVILERAVPAIEDGLKPVQRRILHAMKCVDDGKMNKVANIVGQTMQYHRTATSQRERCQSLNDRQYPCLATGFFAPIFWE